MKQPHIPMASIAKPRESASATTAQATVESHHVSHGLRILGQLTVQDANRAASMIGLQNQEFDEQHSTNRVNQIGPSNLSNVNEHLAAGNQRAIKSIDALLSYQSEAIVLPASNFLQSMTFDCSIQPALSNNFSAGTEESLESPIRESLHTVDNEVSSPNHVVEEAVAPAPAKNDDLKYHPEVRRAVDHLAKQLVKGKSRVWQFHALTAPAHEEAVAQVWPLALCWANLRSESLLVIDATQQGQSLASAWGWQDDVGLQDILFDEKLPSATLKKTHFDKLTFLSRGIVPAKESNERLFEHEQQLRLKSLLMALQRDYAAIWVVTSGEWNSFNHIISESAHKRELVIPISSANTAQIWRASVNKLIQKNVLINGWLALGNSETKQLSA